MSRDLDPRAVRSALAARLHAGAEAVLEDVPVRDDDPARDAATLLDTLAAAAAASPDAALTWLLFTATTGRYPRAEQVRDLRRRLAVEPRPDALGHLLALALHPAHRASTLVEIEVLVDAVVVDVDYSARHDLNTGIQRVVRSTVPHWVAEHSPVLAAWSANDALRRLRPTEAERVLRWSGPLREEAHQGRAARVLVPWRSHLVLPEVPAPALCPALASLAELSGNAVSLIGYDAIPVVSADTMPREEPERFVHYLTLVKHAAAVSAISGSAGEEFAGFVDMLPTQGLRGPDVRVAALPVEIPGGVPVPDEPQDSPPSVLVVGSREPRKNHAAVLYAAEVLWREGLRFSLRFVGGSSWASRPFDARVRALGRAGRPVSIGRAVGDADLWSAYRRARFTVFPSLHEGYGLPVAESFAVGTPVVTSDFGSMRDLAEGGGALLVDPRDDDALVDAMRRLLTDDALRARLRAEALGRSVRTWRDYARDSWEQLVDAVPVGNER